MGTERSLWPVGRGGGWRSRSDVPGEKPHRALPSICPPPHLWGHGGPALVNCSPASPAVQYSSAFPHHCYHAVLPTGPHPIHPSPASPPPQFVFRPNVSVAALESTHISTKSVLLDFPKEVYYENLCLRLFEHGENNDSMYYLHTTTRCCHEKNM